MTNLPAYLQNRTRALATDNLLGHLGAGSPPYISIQGNRFTLIDSNGDSEPVEQFDKSLGWILDAVIVDAGENMSKIYYDKPFDPNAQQYEPPACFSDNGLAPSKNAAKPQARTCAECEKGMWGSKTSAVSGKGVKACSDYQKLAIMIPGDDVTFLLRVPPNSLGNLRAYVAKFKGQPVDYTDVTTRIAFQQGTQGTLLFQAIGYISEKAYAQREKVLASKATDTLVGRLDQPHPGIGAIVQDQRPGTTNQQAALIEQHGRPLAQAMRAESAADVQALHAAVNTGYAATAAALNQNMAAAGPFAQASEPPSSSSTSPTRPSSTTATEPKRRQRRTAQVNPEPAAAAPAGPVTAPFRQEAPQSENPAFGMQAAAPAAANPDLAAALDGLFGPAK